MHPALRIAFVVVGLAAAAYGIASYKGKWLAEPPWWGPRSMTDNEIRLKCIEPGGYSMSVDEYRRTYNPTIPNFTYRELTSAGVVWTGLALAAFGAWGRRRRA